MKNKTVVLLAFYNTKQIGIRFLESNLKRAGFDVLVVYCKRFNSRLPEVITEEELSLLKEFVVCKDPLFVGISAMTSLHLETLEKASRAIKECGKLLIWGGVFSTLAPEKAFESGADYVIVGEGEKAIVEFSEALSSGGDVKKINNVAYVEDGKIIKNPLNPLLEDPDGYGDCDILSKDRYLLDKNELIKCDPGSKSIGYEISASRGCPFYCSYCSSVCLRRLYANNGKFVRFRSVDSVIRELSLAKKQIKGLRHIHFWDEIFSDEEGWIDEFVKRYKREINLPFEIWGHPLKIDKATLEKLVSAGLYEIVVGIQSGSPSIRKDVFHRYETNEEIINASRIIKEAGVPWVTYDFMLRHEFETDLTLKETYELCMKLYGPFELQLHGLSYLPKTDIVKLALERGVYTREEMDGLLYAPMYQNFSDYWSKKTRDPNEEFYYFLIYLSQFKKYREKTKVYSSDPEKHLKDAKADFEKARKKERLRYYMKKGRLLLKSYIK